MKEFLTLIAPAAVVGLLVLAALWFWCRGYRIWVTTDPQAFSSPVDSPKGGESLKNQNPKSDGNS